MTTSSPTRCRFLCLLALLAATALPGCATVKETGRTRLSFFSEASLQEMAAQAYAEASKEHPQITSGPQYEMVQRVGQRIAKASGRNYSWEFRLLQAPDVVNAFALPGGKIAVYSGLLKVTQNEDALAAVMGHEVAHATSGHSDERLSQSAVKNVVMAAGATYTAAKWDEMSDSQRATAMAALGAVHVAAEYGVLLPYSRLHETEADEIGLRFMIRAGYDPYQAPELWQRMATLNPSRPPEFLSTHPDPSNRSKRLRELIPKLLKEERGGQEPHKTR